MNKRLWIAGSVVVCLLMTCCTGIFIVSISGAVSDNVIHPERGAVKAYLKKNAHDPSSLEFVEWGKVTDNGDGVVSVRVTMRAKNGFGAKVVRTQHFTIVDGEVANAVDLY